MLPWNLSLPEGKSMYKTGDSVSIWASSPYMKSGQFMRKLHILFARSRRRRSECILASNTGTSNARRTKEQPGTSESSQENNIRHLPFLVDAFLTMSRPSAFLTRRPGSLALRAARLILERTCAYTLTLFSIEFASRHVLSI
jgi:hypothetical protein